MSNPVNIPALLHSAKPAVQVENGTVVTSSVEVARVFEKRHDDVMKAIKNLLVDLPADCLRNFAETEIARPSPLNGAPIKSPAYHLTRDGFTLLAMGFTGKKALAFKLAYIDAFNRMEAKLSGADNMPANRPAAPLPPSPPPTKTLTFTVPMGETGHRWILHTDHHGREHVTRLDPDMHIGTPAKIVSMLMKSPADLHLDYGQQLAVINTLLYNLHHAAAGHGKRLGLTPASGSRP